MAKGLVKRKCTYYVRTMGNKLDQRLELRIDGKLKRAIEATAGPRGVNAWIREAAHEKLGRDDNLEKIVQVVRNNA